MKTLFALAALAAAAFVIVPTAAQEPVSADRTVAVRHADLDLASRAGVAALDRRIQAAVREACGTASDADVRGKNQVQQCRADTLASVAAQRESAIARQASTLQLASQR
jgi:UrcA family protein